MKKNILKRTQNFMTPFFSKNFMNKNKKTSNPEKISRFFSVLLLFAIVLIALSCEENPSAIGANLIPTEDSVGVKYDTLLTFDSYLTDTNHFNTKNLSDYSIGNFQDPYFGELVGSYAGQFIPSEFFTEVELIDKFSGKTIDSAKIFISINDLYGSPKDEFDFNVYELNSPISSETEFKSNSDISEYFSEADLISSGMSMQGDDTLIISLNEAFYSELIDIGNNFYDSIENFVDKFDGIAIIPEQPADIGGLYNFNVAASNIKMYYQEEDSTHEFTFLLNAGQRFGQYSIDYESAEINNYNDPETPTELIFLQGLGGTQSKLIFSNYSSVFDPSFSYSIHNAELTIPVYQDELFDLCPPPERLFFYTDTNYTVIEDVENSALFNGYFNEESNEYTFNISKYLKDLLNSNIDDPSLHFTISNYILYPNRVILKTGENIKLRVTYTKH